MVHSEDTPVKCKKDPQGEKEYYTNNQDEFLQLLHYDELETKERR